MSYIERLRDRLFSPCMGENPVSALIYARTATLNVKPEASCDAQIASANKFVKAHPSISIAGIYADKGKSGRDTYNREGYTKLLHRLQSEHIDLIITYSLSRLNRNELNSFELNAILSRKEAAIYTIEDNYLHNPEDIRENLLYILSLATDAKDPQKKDTFI